MSSTTLSPLEIAHTHLKPVVADFEPFFGLNLKRNPIPDLEAKFIVANKIMANYIAALAQQEEHPPALKFQQFLCDVMRLLAEDAQDERWNYWLPPFPLGRTYFASHELPRKGENVLLLPKLKVVPLLSPAPSEASSRHIALYQVTPPPPEERPGHTRCLSEKARALSPNTSLVLASKKRALVISSNPSSEEEPTIPKKAKSMRSSKSGEPTTVGGSPGILTRSARLKTPTVKKSSPGFPLIKEAPIKTKPHNKAKHGCPAKKTVTLPSPEVLEMLAAPTTWLQACNHCRENGVFTTCTPHQIGQAEAALPLALGSYERKPFP
ncbi:hypothetical protein AMATHDRAFT_11038 [Amanita thiersii Skay4041]|uniref:Uncharacterized protein n=1 Tax=Amanita thiersii Skay4041 TaxID=703135 RepID=A0A2A9N622_9AGAR|nr:hypothetical protein AMATHDRAFT_11038 [Amanita thiersii Skay4041]